MKTILKHFDIYFKIHKLYYPVIHLIRALLIKLEKRKKT